MGYKALQCPHLATSFEEGIGQLKFSEIDRRPLKDFEVRIRVVATSLNFFDLLMLVGKYQMKPSLPFTVATEASGDVIEVGKNVDHVKVGDSVFVGLNFGSCAEEIIAPHYLCLPKPSSFTFEEASASFVGFTTAYHGLVQRGNLKEGEYLLVTGATGGMGAAAIQLGKLLGAIVIAAVGSEEKLKYAKELGADHVINYSKDDMKKEVDRITNGKFVDVAYEICGGDTFHKCVRCMGDQGRLLVIGFASGTIPKVPANLPLIKGFSIVGVRAGESMRRHPELMMDMIQKFSEWTRKGELKPQVMSFPVHKFKEAFKAIADRKAIGKVVLKWPSVPKASL